MGNFDYLYAEYEVPGFGEGSFFIDHAYLRPPHKVGWEIDDFSTHGQHASRRTFEYERERQNLLVLDGWTVFRLPLDMIRERPRKCQQFVLQTLGRLYGDFGADKEITLPLKQREILRFAHKLQRPFTPADIRVFLGTGDKLTRLLLHDLVMKGWLDAASGTQRVRSFQLRKRH